MDKPNNLTRVAVLWEQSGDLPVPSHIEIVVRTSTEPLETRAEPPEKPTAHQQRSNRRTVNF